MNVFDKYGGFMFDLQNSIVSIKACGCLGVGTEGSALNVSVYQDVKSPGKIRKKTEGLVNDIYIEFESCESVDVFMEKLAEVKEYLKQNEV